MNGTESENGKGLIPRIIQWFLDKQDCSISCSYFEIYNEKIYDLLDTSERKLSSHLDLRETDQKEIIVAGVNVVDISTALEFKKTHDTALKQRSTGATKLNEESSRSHFILQLTIKTRTEDKILVSKVHLIDLAGSEDNKRTGNSGARMNESCSINKSLFVLGQVVEGLNKNHTRIPYRDSKITRLLQDSLGGKALGIMIACCSPDEENFLDTYNTLNFATKSSLIKNVIAVNESIPSKITVDESTARKTSLQEWKAKKKIDLGPPSKKVRTSAEGTKVAEKVDAIKPETSKIEPIPTREDFEREVNSRVEEQVAAKLKELTANLLKSKEQSKPLKLKIALVEQKLDRKLDKKRGEGKENQLEVAESTDIEKLKAVTKQHMLKLLNEGNLKAMYIVFIRMSLKMIGKKRAEAILESREKEGRFVELSELERAGLKPNQITSIFKVSWGNVG
jgi:kinesin family protein 22